MKLEICIDRIESAMAAKDGGADRLEVCGAIGVGGITPSFGLIEQCASLGGVEVMVMVRPHAGGFTYGPDEIRTMQRDICAAKKMGVHGVVIGALQVDGRVDRETCLRLIETARPLSVTFHRAFEMTPDPFEALDTLLDMGVERLLTSGHARSALEGVDLIRELVRRASSGLSVMAAGGIRPEGVVALVLATNVREVHASASELVPGVSLNNMGLVQTTRLTRLETVRTMVRSLEQLKST